MSRAASHHYQIPISRPLSPRELQVLQYLVTGAPDRVIGRALGITEGVVKLHVRSIKSKLGYGTRVWLAVYALTHGLVPAPEYS